MNEHLIHADPECEYCHGKGFVGTYLFKNILGVVCSCVPLSESINVEFYLVEVENVES